MAATSVFADDLLDMKYRAHERYAFGWTDYRGMYSKQRVKRVKLATRNYDQFITNFMGMVIIMIPVTIITYWLWPWL